jgi:hypothetical protein
LSTTTPGSRLYCEGIQYSLEDDDEADALVALGVAEIEEVAE